MKYLLTVSAGIIIFAICNLTGRYILNSRKSRIWFSVALFDFVFAVTSLVILYFAGLTWYSVIAAFLVNGIVIHLSGKYLFTSTIFNRRFIENE